MVRWNKGIYRGWSVVTDSLLDGVLDMIGLLDKNKSTLIYAIISYYVTGRLTRTLPISIICRNHC